MHIGKMFFENWESRLRWQRLQPFVKIAALIERHWYGVVIFV